MSRESSSPPPTDAPGVGIDLIEVARIERALERRPRLGERLFTGAERDYAAGRARPGRHLAARFAAKEAVIKALGGGFGPESVEIRGFEPPTVRLTGSALAAARSLGVEVTVSLTHAREVAGAVAMTRSAA